VLTLQRAVAEYEARFGEHRAELAKARQRTSELELRVLSAQNAYRQAATDELKEATAKMFDLEERLRPSRDASERQKVVAPIAGEVVGLRVFTPGAVVGPRDVLMEIVPDEKVLIVEARIRPEDINHVRAGSEADVRLTAYKYRTTPLVQGAVIYVSGDRLTDTQTGAPYYIVHVKVPPEALAQGGNLKLQAGAPAEVFIRTDERTTFDYLFAPVTAYLRRAMREPL
jgi:membrane fusion protein, epimerase transport system